MNTIPPPKPPTVQPLDLELTITSQFTTEGERSQIVSEITNQITEPPKKPLDLELTVTPQPTPEGEFPQAMPETTTHLTEPPREVVVSVPIYQEVTFPMLHQGEPEYPTMPVVSFQPLDLELTISSEATRERLPPTTTKMSTVPPPKPPTVQPLDLEFTITPQPTSEGELPQILPETTIQISQPPRVAVPIYQEVTVPTPRQDHIEYPTAPVVSFQPLDLELTITHQPTAQVELPQIMQETIPQPSDPPKEIRAQASVFQEVTFPTPSQVHPTEVTVQPLDQELAITSHSTNEVELTQTTQETTTQPPDTTTKVVPTAPPSPEPTEHPTTPVASPQPLDLEPTVNSEPSKLTEYFTTTQETTVSPPQYHKTTLPEQDTFKAVVTVKSLDQELTTPTSHLDVEPSSSTQEILPEPEQPHEEVAAQAPVFYEIPAIQGHTQQPTLSDVMAQHTEVDRTLSTISTVETKLFVAHIILQLFLQNTKRSPLYLKTRFRISM
ncbi:leucine-rich repeat-containing protein 37A-like [Microtus ochrogaster]|uniref:Leucine-rich repeat-containing protein 37A-like n=2 Tax=Microtus ochrogaster TaxID=79684 RepID=A0ABM1TX52_MICOH|nr:leucine-rich repeat-containing protein 37A-like [Microtus ochrogaster]